MFFVRILKISYYFMNQNDIDLINAIKSYMGVTV